jgi:hypothetical protein
MSTSRPNYALKARLVLGLDQVINVPWFCIKQECRRRPSFAHSLDMEFISTDKITIFNKLDSLVGAGHDAGSPVAGA